MLQVADEYEGKLCRGCHSCCLVDLIACLFFLHNTIESLGSRFTFKTCPIHMGDLCYRTEDLGLFHNGLRLRGWCHSRQ